MTECESPSGARVEIRHAAAKAVSGEWTEARRLCMEILREDPCNAGAFHILGAVSSCEGDLKSAAGYLSRAVELQPWNPGWLRDLAVLLIAAADWPGALHAVSRCLALQPDDVEAMSIEARGLWESGHNEEALAACDRWSAAQPGAARPWLGAAQCLIKLKRYEEAAARACRALQLEPDSVSAHQLAAEIHSCLHQHEQALEHRLEVARLLPGDAEAMAMAAVAYYQIGETDQAVSLFRSAIATGVSADVHAAFPAILLHHYGSTPQLLAKEHQEWARRYTTRLPRSEAVFPSLLSHGRRLRVAYLCTENATSPAFRFLAPLLRHHDRSRFDFSLYCVDSSLKGCAGAFGLAEAELKSVAEAPESIAEQIARDGADILVDFSGHYGGGSLLVAAMRAAPIQVSFPSYPATTGIPEMDYIFTDRWTCEPGQESQYTERPYRLDSGYLVYDPPESARLDAALPAQRTGHVTFGIFQRLAKLNSHVWDAVAGILSRVEHSRLLVHHASADLDSAAGMSQRRILAALESRGIVPGRVSFRGLVPSRVHMRLVSTVDIALDSFPYTGQTTTCDCLWMGVPVVTLAGSTHVSRVCAGLLMRAGLGELVARDVEEYVRIGVRTASDLGALAALRKGLRRRVRASTLLNGERLAREVEAAYRWMWQQRNGRASAASR
jgi:protein O-GlcNAc transferase